jgi:excisionase family DNA binding protein
VIEVTLHLNGVPVPVTLDDDAIAAIAAEVAEQRPQSEPPEWLTVKTAAVYLGLTEAAVRKLIDRLGIPKNQHVKGGRVLIRRHDLDAALTDRGSR